MAAITPITMPKFGLAMTEGKVAAWSRAEGSRIKVGDEIADIETTKITNAYESPVAGVLRRLVAPEQEDLPVGALIAVVADPSVPDPEIDAFIAAFQAEFATRATEAEAAAPEPRSVDAGGRSIRVLDTGPADADGAPIVLVHGFGGDLNNWMFTQPALSERHRVIALDLPGHGGSAKDVGAGDIATLAGAVRALLAALDVTRAHLVGHSLGGAIVLHLALEAPAVAASVTLLAPAALGREIDDAFTADFISASRRKQLEPVLARLFADPSLVSREMAEELLRFKRLDGAQAALTAIRTANFAGGQQTVLRDRLGTLGAVPVQVIWGSEDQIIPAAHAEGLPATVRVRVLHDVGHMPHMERASEVTRLILDLTEATAPAG